MANRSNSTNLKSKLKASINSTKPWKSNKIDANEKCKLLEVENDNLKRKLECLEREILQKNCNKSDILEQKHLQNENDYLKSTLLFQEKDFPCDNKSLIQKLTSLVRSSEVCQQEIDLFNNETNSFENYLNANDLASLIEITLQENKSELDGLNNLNEAKAMLNKKNIIINKLLVKLKENLKNKHDEVQRLKHSQETLQKLNESKIQEILRVEFDSQLEVLKKKIRSLEEEKTNLQGKCFTNEEHIRLLEATVSCISSEKSKVVHELSQEKEFSKNKIQELEFKLQETNKENEQHIKELHDRYNFENEEKEKENKNERLKLQVKIYDLAKRYSDLKRQSERQMQDILHDLELKAKNETKYLNAIKFMKRELQLARNCCC